MEKNKITVTPFDMKYLNDYYREFDAEITKYQWPEPFSSLEDAKELLEEFISETKKGEMCFFSILSENGAFIGSAELHGLKSDCPEIGIWIISSQWNKGYAYRALSTVLEEAQKHLGIKAFFYEADKRNTGSMKLLRKFEDRYDIIEQGYEEFTTDSGKELQMKSFVLEAKAD